MLKYWMLSSGAVLLCSSAAAAQSPATLSSSASPFPAPSARSPLARQSTPEFLEAEQNTAIARQQQTPSTAKDCPMPVHRPDTSRLERMGVAAPPQNVSYSMPRADLKCVNPLDRSK
jgi:hypothetical protein